MAEFIFDTNSMSSTTYDGPSGMRYIIYLNKPFNVINQQDINFFRGKNQFSEVGILTPEPEKPKDVDVLLKEELIKLKGLNEKIVDKIVELYFSKEHLTDVIQQNYELDNSIPNKYQKIIKKHFGVKFDSVDTIKKRIKKKKSKKRR